MPPEKANTLVEIFVLVRIFTQMNISTGSWWDLQKWYSDCTVRTWSNGTTGKRRLLTPWESRPAQFLLRDFWWRFAASEIVVGGGGGRGRSFGFPREGRRRGLVVTSGVVSSRKISVPDEYLGYAYLVRILGICLNWFIYSDGGTLPTLIPSLQLKNPTLIYLITPLIAF